MFWHLPRNLKLLLVKSKQRTALVLCLPTPLLSFFALFALKNEPLATCPIFNTTRLAIVHTRFCARFSNVHKKRIQLPCCLDVTKAAVVVEAKLLIIRVRREGQLTQAGRETRLYFLVSSLHDFFKTC